MLGWNLNLKMTEFIFCKFSQRILGHVWRNRSLLDLGLTHRFRQGLGFRWTNDVTFLLPRTSLEPTGWLIAAARCGPVEATIGRELAGVFLSGRTHHTLDILNLHRFVSSSSAYWTVFSMQVMKTKIKSFRFC